MLILLLFWGSRKLVESVSNVSFLFLCSDQEHEELLEQCEILRQAQADQSFSRLAEFENGSSDSERDTNTNNNSRESFQSTKSEPNIATLV